MVRFDISKAHGYGGVPRLSGYQLLGQSQYATNRPAQSITPRVIPLMPR